jgi:hypothetical protein
MVREQYQRLQTMTRDTSRLQQDQLERLTEIGLYLRQVREEYRLSLDEIASRTMIQARLLRALEDGRIYQTLCRCPGAGRQRICGCFSH